MDRADIADDRIVKLVLSRDREAEGRARCYVNRSADGEMRNRGRVDQDAAARAGEGRTDRVRGRNGLIPSGLERGAEAGGAVGQGAVSRQSSLAVGTGKVNRARVATGRVIKWILSHNREVEG